MLDQRREAVYDCTFWRLTLTFIYYCIILLLCIFCHICWNMLELNYHNFIHIYNYGFLVKWYQQNLSPPQKHTHRGVAWEPAMWWSVLVMTSSSSFLSGETQTCIQLNYVNEQQKSTKAESCWRWMKEDREREREEETGREVGRGNVQSTKLWLKPARKQSVQIPLAAHWYIYSFKQFLF